MHRVAVGTCGYSRFDAGEDWQSQYESKLAAYADAYPMVELNRTFYDLPMERTARRWREEVGSTFGFAVKVWQAVTHPTSSPTWRDRDDLTAAQREHFGYLEPHEVVFEAWRDTLDVASAMGAETVLVQTPPSFGPEEPGPDRVRAFFEGADRDGFRIAWEPRGDWLDRRDLVAELCGDLDLAFVVDPLRDPLPGVGDLGYFRLHGLNADRYDYAYEYADDELDWLVDVLEDVREDFDRVYCLFNNFNKFEDARRLRDRLGGA